VVKSVRVVNRVLVCRDLQFAYNLVKLNVLVNLCKAILSAFLQHFTTKLRNITNFVMCSFKLWWNFFPDLSRSKFRWKGERSIVEVCESDPNPIGFVRILEPKYKFRIGLNKMFRSRIGSDFDIRNKMN
jgi:hypothetical protein